jgi:hypothetical protein
MRTFSVLSISLLVVFVNVAFAAGSSSSPTTQASPASSAASGACVGKSLGVDCSYGDLKGNEIEGVCTTMSPGKPLVCSPMKGTHNGGGSQSGQSHGQVPGRHPAPAQSSPSGSSQ